MSRRHRRRTQEEMDLSRREFLWKGACAALTATGIASTISDLRLMNAAVANSIAPAAVASDYKALVCIFLFGGNDGNNLLVPTDPAPYAQYAAARGALAIPYLDPQNPNAVIALETQNNDGISYGLHPRCTDLVKLFNAGKCAIIANVGTLLAPLTAAQYKAKSVAVP